MVCRVSPRRPSRKCNRRMPLGADSKDPPRPTLMPTVLQIWSHSLLDVLKTFDLSDHEVGASVGATVGVVVLAILGVVQL